MDLPSAIRPVLSWCSLRKPMPSPVQSALKEALAEIKRSASIKLTFSSVTFDAWPAKMPEIELGSVAASQTVKVWLEARTAPAFKRGDSIEGVNPNSGEREYYTVSDRYPANLYKGTFIFALLPGRDS